MLRRKTGALLLSCPVLNKPQSCSCENFQGFCQISCFLLIHVNVQKHRKCHIFRLVLVSSGYLVNSQFFFFFCQCLFSYLGDTLQLIKHLLVDLFLSRRISCLLFNTQLPIQLIFRGNRLQCMHSYAYQFIKLFRQIAFADMGLYLDYQSEYMFLVLGQLIMVLLNFVVCSIHVNAKNKFHNLAHAKAVSRLHFLEDFFIRNNFECISITYNLQGK